MRRSPTRGFTVDIAAVVYTAGYFLWLAVRTPGTAGTELVSLFWFLPLGLCVSWAYWRNTGHAAPDRPTRLAWTGLAIAALGLWFTGNTWSMYLWVAGPRQWPAWLDWLEAALSLFIIGSYLTFPGRPLAKGARARFLLDAGLIVVAGFVLAISFALWTLPNQSGPVWSYTVATITIDWVMFVIAAVGTIQKRDASIRIALAMLLGAHGLTLIANSRLASLPAYHSGDPLDALWFMAWVLRWSAARTAWHRARLGINAGEADSTQTATAFRSSVFAYLMVAGTFVLLVLQLYSGNPQFVRLLAMVTIVMVALLFLRQIAALYENRRLFEAQLAQEGRFRSLVQNASDLIVVVDRAGSISYVSPSGARAFGEAPALKVGAEAKGLFPPEDASALLESGETDTIGPRRVQSRILSATGEWREIEVVATDLRSDAAVEGIVLNCRDVTERTALERKLLHAQKLDAIGRLAGGLAHDLNNVLAVVRGYAELLRDDLPAGSKAFEDLRQIEHAADKASGITKKLLGLSRNQAVQRGSVDLNQVLRGLEPILRQVLTDGIEIEIECDPALWPVSADQGQMEQLLINLVTNARDAMPRGGHLRITTVNYSGQDVPRTEGAVLPPGPFVAIAVADEGVGMSPEVQARVFEPFFTTKPPTKGLGLGLSMVQSIATESGGFVHLDSAPGRGSTFTIVLPRTGASAVEADGAEPADAGALRGRSVLLVDDEFAVRAVSRRILEREGCRVYEMSSAADALEVAADGRNHIDALLTDLVMPQMNGRELIARFRQQRPGVPIVCMSGFADASDDASDLGESVVALIAKPFSAATLVRALAGPLASSGRAPVRK